MKSRIVFLMLAVFGCSFAHADESSATKLYQNAWVKVGPAMSSSNLGTVNNDYSAGVRLKYGELGADVAFTPNEKVSVSYLIYQNAGLVDSLYGGAGIGTSLATYRKAFLNLIGGYELRSHNRFFQAVEGGMTIAQPTVYTSSNGSIDYARTLNLPVQLTVSYIVGF